MSFQTLEKHELQLQEANGREGIEINKIVSELFENIVIFYVKKLNNIVKYFKLCRVNRTFAFRRFQIFVI